MRHAQVGRFALTARAENTDDGIPGDGSTLPNTLLQTDQPAQQQSTSTPQSPGALHSTTRAYVELVLSALFWAGNFFVGKTAVASLPVFSLVFLRWLFALVPLLAAAQIIEHPDWRATLAHWRFIVMQGFLGILVYSLLLYGALLTSTPFSASLINAANPALIALAAHVVLHERLGVQGIGGIALALLGVCIVLTEGDLTGILHTQFTRGDLLMVVASMCWTVYTIAGRKGPKLPAITQVALQTLATVILLALFIPFFGLQLPTSAPLWGSIVFIALFPSFGSYVLWNRALTVVPSSKTGVFLSLVTLFTAIWSVIVGAPITTPQLIGAVCIIGGVILTTWPTGKNPA